MPRKRDTFPLVNRCCFRSRLVHAGCVFVLLTAWLAVSNHCALSALRGGLIAGAAQKECCHALSASGHEPRAPQCPPSICCKGWRALPLDAEVKLVTTQPAHLLVDFLFVVITHAASPAAPVADITPAARPPALVSFAEAVLQRSLRSHAPPFLV